ncbi:MAG: glycosyltransferase family 2 protein [Solirubrobacteraceae bacterium]
MLVSAIVVSFNRCESTVRCVESLLVALDGVAGPTEVIVVDNNSHDDSVPALRRLSDRLRVIGMARNLGFAGAVSEGMRQSSGQWVLLLNNDATIEPEAVIRLLEVGSGDESIGSLAPMILFSGDAHWINSTGLVVDRLGIGHDRLLGQPAADRDTAPVEVFGASGGAALFRRSMLEDAGGVDASFFMYLEDLDLAWRARARGWRAMHVPEAVVHHDHSLSAGHGSDLKYFHVGLNRVRVLAKNADRQHLLRYGPAMLLYDIAYVTYAAMTDRTLAPLRGRLTGIRQWRRYRRRRAVQARPVPLMPISGLRAALGRRRVWLQNSAGVRPGVSKPRGPT